MTNAPRQPRRSRLVPLLILLAAVAGVFAVTLKPWRPFVYGRVAPPWPDLEAVEPALAARLKIGRMGVVYQPYEAAAWGRYAGVLEIHGLTPEAIARYERAERLDGDAFAWVYGRGRCLLQADVTAALAPLARAIELAPDYAAAHVRRGLACVATERADEADEHFRAALRLDPRLTSAHVGRAEIALARGADAEALAHLDRALGAGAASAQTHWLAAEAARRAGDDGRAAAHAVAAEAAPYPREPVPDPLYDRIVEVDGVTLEWRKKRAQARAARGDLAAALGEWEAVRRDQPGNLEAILAIGLLKVRANDRPGAIAAFTEALEIDPDQPKVRGNLGGLLVGVGRADEGLAELRAAARALPDEPAAHVNLARALRTTGHPDEALDVAARALALDANHPLARREHAAASAAVARRLATSPDATARDGAAARRMMDPLCAQADPPDPYLLDVLAAACAETGDYAAAARHARRARALVAAATGRRDTWMADLTLRIELYESGRPYRSDAP